MIEDLNITLIKEEVLTRLRTIDDVSAQMGYFVHFEEDKSPFLAVLQADYETPEDQTKRPGKQLNTRAFNLVLGVRFTEKMADSKRDGFLFKAIEVLFTELSNPLNALAKEFKHDGDVQFSLTESGSYLIAIVPLQIKYLQTTP